MLLTLDSNAFWVTKSAKDTRSARRKIIVRDLVWERFSCAFSSSCSTNTFQVRKPAKVLSRSVFFVHLRVSSCSSLLWRAFLTASNCSLTKGQENSKFACCYAALKSGLSLTALDHDPAGFYAPSFSRINFLARWSASLSFSGLFPPA